MERPIDRQMTWKDNIPSAYTPPLWYGLSIINLYQKPGHKASKLYH